MHLYCSSIDFLGHHISEKGIEADSCKVDRILSWPWPHLAMDVCWFLENFDTQLDLSCCQAHWMEFMSQFDTKIVYIKGGDNTIADALSRLPVEISATSEATIKNARSPYGFCPDDSNDDSIAVNAVLPATHACPLLSTHALAKTDIAMMQAITAVLSISQDP